ncbi:MAG: hypothetical protein GY885_06335, partial [Phycisphaeraceae bacterium]|nr:hypothetical protein [Phycisphaeraceae bacterium]
MNRMMHAGLIVTLAQASIGVADDGTVVQPLPRLADVDRTRYAADGNPDGGSEPFFPFQEAASPLDLDAARSEPLDPLFPDPLGPLVRPLRNIADWTSKEIGLEWDVFYTLLYQHASRSLDDQPRDA